LKCFRRRRVPSSAIGGWGRGPGREFPGRAGFLQVCGEGLFGSASRSMICHASNPPIHRRRTEASQLRHACASTFQGLKARHFCLASSQPRSVASSYAASWQPTWRATGQPSAVRPPASESAEAKEHRRGPPLRLWPQAPAVFRVNLAPSRWLGENRRIGRSVSES